MAFLFLKKLFVKPLRSLPPAPERTELPPLEALDEDTADDFVKGGNGEIPKLWNGIPSRDWTIY
jgi:hypothetical protein